MTGFIIVGYLWQILGKGHLCAPHCHPWPAPKKAILNRVKGIPPSSHLECYCHFVIAYQYICHSTIKANSLHIVVSFLMKFCKWFEELYGSEKITLNMHLLGDIKDCTMDMGALYGFLLFSFEQLVQILISFWYFRRKIRAIHSQYFFMSK